jgi:hypothetical protein
MKSCIGVCFANRHFVGVIHIFVSKQYSSATVLVALRATQRGASDAERRVEWSGAEKRDRGGFGKIEGVVDREKRSWEGFRERGARWGYRWRPGGES